MDEFHTMKFIHDMMIYILIQYRKWHKRFWISLKWNLPSTNYSSFLSVACFGETRKKKVFPTCMTFPDSCTFSFFTHKTCLHILILLAFTSKLNMVIFTSYVVRLNYSIHYLTAWKREIKNKLMWTVLLNQLFSRSFSFKR